MRLRNVKNKQEIMDNAINLILNPKDYKGRWKEVFNNNNPIYIEIGMGKGDFIIEHAKRYPDINFIGIERFDSVIVRAIEKVPEEIPNLRLVRMDAKDIEEVFDKEISRIFLNFSDPWPKKRAHKKRLSSDSFIKMYDQVLAADGEIQMKTDNEQLFEFSILAFQNAGWKLIDFTVNYRRDQHDEDAITEYETRFMNLGQPIFRAVWKR